MRLQGKTALITAAGQGIGRATAEAFAAEGLQVVVSDVDVAGGEGTVQLIRDAGGEAVFVRCDVTREAEVKVLMERTLGAYGRLDYAFNNAGIEIEKGKLAEGSEAEFDAIMGVNVKGVWLCMKHQLPLLLAQGGGAIVNTASQWGLYPAPNHIAYNVTKAAVASFTQNLARDYAPQKIRVNAVCPGEIHTPMLEAGVKRSGRTIADLDKLVPFGRIGKPEEVAALVAFLASDAAGYITGQVISINGGMA